MQKIIQERANTDNEDEDSILDKHPQEQIPMEEDKITHNQKTKANSPIPSPNSKKQKTNETQQSDFPQLPPQNYPKSSRVHHAPNPTQTKITPANQPDCNQFSSEYTENTNNESDNTKKQNVPPII